MISMAPEYYPRVLPPAVYTVQSGECLNAVSDVYARRVALSQSTEITHYVRMELAYDQREDLDRQWLPLP